MPGIPPTLSVVVPIFNEADSLKQFNADLLNVLSKQTDATFEVIYCNDGSNDGSDRLLKTLAKNKSVKLISLSRNFGKESALAAGIAAAHGQAIIMIDGDGQHPVKLLPEFIKQWQKGARVVIGRGTYSRQVGFFKRLSSAWFYRIFNSLSNQTLVSGSSDYRLIDRSVQQEFLKLSESDRMTRGLIDWLGFQPVYIAFEKSPRRQGEASLGFVQLTKLAVNSLVSLSPKPLYLFGYLGVLITLAAGLLGLSVIIEQLILNDPLKWKFTGTAMLGILILFLVGLVLLSQGILSIYVSHVHSQTKNRPLYIVDSPNSVGIDEPDKT